jgi:hypothetical protein
MKSFKQYITEASFGHTLWIDPKGKVYDMNSRKEITHPKGHPYTHYDWVNANFTKYFGKSKAKKNPTLGTLDSPPPDKSGDVYDTPMEMGWARVRNGRVSLDVEVKLSKLNRSQKKVIRDIVDTDHKRPLYIDIWKKNKTSRTGDLGFQDYDAIVDFLSEEDCGYDETNETKTAAWSRKAGKNPEGGLNAKGRASYERENPGSDLKPPVSRETAAKSPKSAARRKSFCARMGGMPGAMKGDDGKPTRKALALRKWDC